MDQRRNVWTSPGTWVLFGVVTALMIVVGVVAASRSPYSAACNKAYHAYERFQNSLPAYAQTVDQGDNYGLSQSDYCQSQHLR